MKTLHGQCGKSWWQSGNRTSHCSGCHETFASLSLFDAHRRDGACLDPNHMTHAGKPLAVEFPRDLGPVWYSPAAREAMRDVFTEKGTGQ